MAWWCTAICVFAFAIVSRVLINVRRLVRLQKIESYYFEWQSGKSKKFPEFQPELIELFKKAGISDGAFSVTELAGYGMVRSGTASYFENAQSNRADVASVIVRSIGGACGQFRRNIIESINPICWIEFLIFLPKHLLAYLDVKEQSALTKVIQVIWWIIAPAAVIFRDKLYELIFKLP